MHIFPSIFLAIYFQARFTAATVNKTEHSFRKLPEFLKICHRNDPHLNSCVKSSVEHIRPYLPKGIPEFGIPPCEPLLIPEIVINQGGGPVSIQSTYTNIHLTGATQFLIKKVLVNLEKDQVHIKLWFPLLNIISDYELDGRILMLPISGQGVCMGNYTDINATITMDGEKYQKKGKGYYHVNNFSVNFDVGSASVALDDLFRGDHLLGNTMNGFVNDNWNIIVKEIKPVLEDTMADMFKTFANNIYHKYPLDCLLPP